LIGCSGVRPRSRIGTHKRIPSRASEWELLGDDSRVNCCANGAWVARATDRKPRAISWIEFDERVDLAITVVVDAIVALLRACLITEDYCRNRDETN